MSFLKRLYYYSTGFIIGIIFLFFIFNGKRTSCNYGPSARVIDNIISKDLILNSNVQSIDSAGLINLISEGRVIFNKSEPNQKPCGVYYIETDSLNFIITNCESAATVEIKQSSFSLILFLLILILLRSDPLQMCFHQPS